MENKIKRIEDVLSVILKKINIEELSDKEKHNINKKINDILKKIKISKMYEKELIIKIKGKL
jgi:hypothetical protein